MKNTLQGNGTVKFNDEITYTGSFCVEVDYGGIWHKRQNVFFLELDQSLVQQSLSDLPFSPWEFEGVSDNGEKIRVSNMALTKRNENFNQQSIYVQFGFHISELFIGNIDEECEHIQFLIPNFLIGFDRISTHGGRNKRNITNLDLKYKDASYSIEMIGLNDFATNEKEIIKNYEDIVTVQMNVRRENEKIRYNDAKEVVELILELCTIAYGGRVSWTTCIAISSEESIFRILRDVPLAPLKPFHQLIRVSYPGYFSYFIRSGFPSYSELNKEERLSLMKLVEGIHFSVLRLTFPAPFVILGSVIEEFSYSELEENLTYFINKSSRRELFPKFKAFVDENIIEMIDESEKSFFEEGELKQKLSGLLQKNLRARIVSLLDFFQVEYDMEWVRQFVKKRNESAHGTYQFAVEDYLVFTRMVALLEKVILTKIQYKGEFLDWSIIPPEWRQM
jgi:hypothetical protein